jgi:hypothetical protein
VEKDKDERKRSHLRLVVSNPEKRPPRTAAEENFVPFEDLLAKREEISPVFYDGLDELHGQAYAQLEAHFQSKGWPYALDPDHGRLMVLPAGAMSPGTLDLGAAAQDEILIFITDDAAGGGVCLSIEMILPYFSEDESVMEEALLYSPIFQYGTLFLEENRQDGLLDLIYRLGFPLFPPTVSPELLERLFSIAAFELAEALKSLCDYQEES